MSLQNRGTVSDGTERQKARKQTALQNLKTERLEQYKVYGENYANAINI